MTARHGDTGNAFATPAAVPAGPPPPPPPTSRAGADRALAPTPQDPYFVTSTGPQPVLEPVAPPPASNDSWLKPALAVIALLVGGLGGFWAVRTLRSDDPVLNKGADGAVSTIEVDSVFVPLRGYQYKMLPEGVEGQVSQIVSSVPEAQEKLLGFGMRGVARGGQVVGVVTVAGVTPETIEDRGERQSAFDGIEEAGGSDPEGMQLGGLEVYTTEIPTGNPLLPKAQTVLYFYENLVVMVIGFDETTAQDISTKLIEAGP